VLIVTGIEFGIGSHDKRHLHPRPRIREKIGFEKKFRLLQKVGPSRSRGLVLLGSNPCTELRVRGQLNQEFILRGKWGIEVSNRDCVT
jgi:hypothetical protein